MESQSVVESNSDAAGDPWAALDNAAYICFKREVPPFMLHDLHSVDPLQEKIPMSPRGRATGVLWQAQQGEGKEPGKGQSGFPVTEPRSGLLPFEGSV